MRLSLLFAPLVAASVAFGAVLEERQTRNTNAQISAIVSAHSQNVWLNIPQVLEKMAEHRAQQTTTNIDALTTGFNAASTALSRVAASTGSNTTSPTDTEIHVIFAAALSQTGSGLSALNEGNVRGVTAKFKTLDTQIARMITTLNSKLPNTQSFAHLMLLDARQFFQKEGMTQTLTALGF